MDAIHNIIHRMKGADITKSHVQLIRRRPSALRNSSIRHIDEYRAAMHITEHALNISEDSNIRSLHIQKLAKKK